MISTLPSAISIETDSTFVTTLDYNSSPTIEAEMSLWLGALQSFVRTENLPLNNLDEQQQLAQRDWSGELRIAYWGLLKALQISSRLSTTDVLNSSDQAALQKLLQESAELSEALIAQGKVTVKAWGAWHDFFNRRLDESGAVALLNKTFPEENQNFPAALEALAHHPSLHGILGADIGEIIKKFFVLLERLRMIEEMLKRDQPLRPSLLLFTLIRQETLTLLKQIENTLALLLENSPLHEVLDGILYVTPLELRKVFAHELVNIVDLRQAPLIFARVENACGLLKDCYQQAVVAIAQVFAPQFQGTEIFSNYLTRLEQSLILRRELWKLLKFIQTVEKSSDAGLLPNTNRELASFRQNTMQFLMFKDFETTERFIEEISRTRQYEEVIQVLHRFAAYLETLLGQVNMRNVLADHPFDYPEVKF